MVKGGGGGPSQKEGKWQKKNQEQKEGIEKREKWHGQQNHAGGAGFFEKEILKKYKRETKAG